MRLANNTTVHILQCCDMEVNLGLLEAKASVERGPQNLRTVERWNRLYDIKTEDTGARGSVGGWGPVLQAGRSPIRFPTRSLDFSTDLIFPAALWLWSRLSLEQKWVPGIFLGVKGSRRLRLTTSPPYVIRLSRKMWEPRRLTTLCACTACYRDSFTFKYLEFLVVYIIW
jgi:hypothetical protein